MIERHHNVPISLEGYDIEENIIPLKKHVHKHLHSTLNIPYCEVRVFRAKTSHKVIKDKEYIQELRKVHKKFFDEDKLSKLAGDTIAKIAHSLADTTDWIYREYDIEKEERDTMGDVNAVTNNLYKYHNGIWRASKKMMGL